MKQFFLDETRKEKLQGQTNTRIFKNGIVAASDYCLYKELKIYNSIQK